MRILMIHPHDLHSSLEPWTVRIIKFADELADKGHEITVLYCPLTRSEQRVFRGIKFIPLERKLSCKALLHNTFFLFKRARHADIIHFQKAHFYMAIPVLLAAALSGKPLHYDWDDWEEKIFDRAILKKNLTSVVTGFSFYWLERWLPFLSDSVSVSSSSLRRLAIIRGANERKVVLAPVGADLKRFHPDRSGEVVRTKYDINTAVLVLYHGQLHSCQYVRIFLKAIKIIEQSRVELPLRFIVVGTGSDLLSLQSFARDLGLDQKVIFTDYIPHADIPDYVAAADICVAPFEDNEVTRCKSPLKIAEYMAAGKPVVASDVGEVRSMLEGVGLLVKPCSPEEMAQGILKLAVNPELRRKMSLEARRRAEYKYNWRCSAEALEKVYRSIV